MFGIFRIINRIRWIVASLIFLCAFGLSFLYSSLNSPSFFEKNIPQWLNPRMPGVVIKELHIGRQSFSFPCQLHFKNIQVHILQGSQKIIGEIRAMDLRGTKMFSGQRQIFLRGEGLKITSDLVKVQAGQLTADVLWKGATVENIRGDFKSAEVSLQNYLLTDLSTKISGDQSRIFFNDFKANFYGGQMKGQIFLDYPKDIPYSITMELANVDLRQLRKVNPDFFSKVQGRLHGLISVRGGQRGLSALEASFDAPKGGEVKASLLQYLLEYIPQSVQRKDLEKLIKTDGNIPLEKADVIIKSLSDEKASANIQMESRKFNLDVDVTVDVNIEGGLNKLFKSF